MTDVGDGPSAADDRGAREFDAFELDPDESRRERPAGLSSGFKLALASILGCGGCLTLVAVAIAIVGTQFFDALGAAPPAGERFVEALEDGREEDARRMVLGSARARPSFEDDLRATLDGVDDLGLRVRRSVTRSFFRSDLDGRHFELGLRTRYESATVQWDLVLEEDDDVWRVVGWRARRLVVDANGDPVAPERFETDDASWESMPREFGRD